MFSVERSSRPAPPLDRPGRLVLVGTFMVSQPTSSTRFVILAFNARNLLAVQTAGKMADVAFDGIDLETATRDLSRAFKTHTPPAEYYRVEYNHIVHRIHFSQVVEPAADPSLRFTALDQLQANPASLSPLLAKILGEIDPYLIEIPYLHLSDNDFIFKFRPDNERNRLIYQADPASHALYQSKLCEAIKALARTHERTAVAPVSLDFGAVQYVIPSHFGFCLGVKNAIERAYETLAENAGRHVFMLSELIHNPFVNEDLLRRGLRYLQTDKGTPYTVDGIKSTGAPGEQLLWDKLSPDDIVIIPAFGATDDDKRRLVRKGVPVYQYDATCMLVEKVWKAARAFGEEGYTVVIHGKHEHEETKATFSNARRHAHAVIVRNMDEARLLGEIIASDNPSVRARFYQDFAGKHTPGFDVNRHLERIAVVNQTTLLMNETLEILTHLRGVYIAKLGEAEGSTRVGGGGKRDTLCYATQVNQDALSKALAGPLDLAFVIGGKNSSNTYQLYRLCEQRLGERAFFIQGEANIRSADCVEHYLFPAKGSHGHGHDQIQIRKLPAHNGAQPLRVLLTGGASCPDGIIQQVITRINSLFPALSLRGIDEVLAGLKRTTN
ncbi:MAG: 4-hydroxy-3-methylbut-2-enyl diphosphate reductase [Nibricoccus sp.]